MNLAGVSLKKGVRLGGYSLEYNLRVAHQSNTITMTIGRLNFGSWQNLHFSLCFQGLFLLLVCKFVHWFPYFGNFVFLCNIWEKIDHVISFYFIPNLCTVDFFLFFPIHFFLPSHFPVRLIIVFYFHFTWFEKSWKWPPKVTNVKDGKPSCFL